MSFSKKNTSISSLPLSVVLSDILKASFPRLSTFEAILSENSENIRDKSPAIDFGISAGIPESSKLKMSGFPVLSLFMDIPEKLSGLVMVMVVISLFTSSALPLLLLSPSEKIKSTDAE